jgi:hypothetical protein
VAATIEGLILKADLAGETSTQGTRISISVLKSLPLKIGKKWNGIACCCVRAIKENIEQADLATNPALLRLFQDETVRDKSEHLDKVKHAPNADGSTDIDSAIKFGVLWTFTRGKSFDTPNTHRTVREDKIIKYSARTNLNLDKCGNGVVYIDENFEAGV